MKTIEIQTNLDPLEIEELQKYYINQGSFCVDEEYISPNKQHSLHLCHKYELRGGPSVYKAKLVSKTSNASYLNTLKKIFIERNDYGSLGQYGVGYAYWSGNPWSNNSQYIALIKLEVKLTLSKLYIVDVVCMEKKQIMQAYGYISNCMWSHDDKYYLFRDINSCCIYDLDKQVHSIIYKGNTFQKHCFFTNDNTIILIDDDLVVRVINPTNYLIEVEYPIKSALNNTERIDYSIWDNINNRLCLGIDFYALDSGLAKCKKWFGVMLS